MIVRSGEIHDEHDRARLGVGLAADALGIDCDMRLTTQWLVKADERDRKAFIDLAREAAQKGAL